ncbi:unnamed protein product [Brugia timori]|uniref:Uncharacterized protein n=1 Tax=Brugia timori TaxID=42155 RepID=A0A0R3QEE8_9BILA|nr:unnamed protein product [Brugia timori]
MFFFFLNNSVTIKFQKIISEIEKLLKLTDYNYFFP